MGKLDFLRSAQISGELIRLGASKEKEVRVKWEVKSHFYFELWFWKNYLVVSVAGIMMLWTEQERRGGWIQRFYPLLSVFTGTAPLWQQKWLLSFSLSWAYNLLFPFLGPRCLCLCVCIYISMYSNIHIHFHIWLVQRLWRTLIQGPISLRAYW